MASIDACDALKLGVRGADEPAAAGGEVERAREAVEALGQEDGLTSLGGGVDGPLNRGRVVGRTAVAVVSSSRALRICLLIAEAEKLGT